jgi:hypothetical protein
MAKLTTKQRKALPASTFALPGGRFPINDKNHARAAITGASRSFNVGNISASQKATIDRKAEAKLSDHAKNVQKAINSKRVPSPRDGHK